MTSPACQNLAKEPCFGQQLHFFGEYDAIVEILSLACRCTPLIFAKNWPIFCRHPAGCLHFCTIPTVRDDSARPSWVPSQRQQQRKQQQQLCLHGDWASEKFHFVILGFRRSQKLQNYKENYRMSLRYFPLQK